MLSLGPRAMVSVLSFSGFPFLQQSTLYFVLNILSPLLFSAVDRFEFALICNKLQTVNVRRSIRPINVAVRLSEQDETRHSISVATPEPQCPSSTH